MNILPFVKINRPKIVRLAAGLPSVGSLEISKDNLVYLDIDDSFIHSIYPLLRFEAISKPDYFGDNLIGAHISVIYPEENIILKPEDLHQEHSFEITGLYSALRNDKLYYVIGIHSPSLLQLREKYHLPEKPCYKNLRVAFHITVAVRLPGVN